MRLSYRRFVSTFECHAQPTFGRTILEKTLHLIEAHFGIDLSRAPVHDAAGPVD